MSEIEIVQVRELSHEDAEREIMEYVGNAGLRVVSIAELAHELRIEFDMIEEILEDRDDEFFYGY
jgi:uncharacterized protein YrzB (UPF0473 family)